MTATVQWVIVGGIAVLSLIVALLVVKLRKYEVTILGAIGGYFGGLYLITTFIISDSWLYYLVIIGCPIVAAVISFYTQTLVIELITSFVGSYAAIRGVSIFAGKFPNEWSLKYYDFKSFPKEFYYYFAAIVVLTIICFTF